MLPTQPLAVPLVATEPPKALTSAAFVFVQRGIPGAPLSLVYDGPYKVLARGPKSFTLQLGGRQEQVSVDRLKPCLAQEVTPAAPPRRGRPPKIQSPPS